MTVSHDAALVAARRSDGPVGIGGWLIMPIIGLCGTTLITGYNLLSGLSEWDGVKAVITGSNPTAAALRFPMGLSTLLGLATIAFALTCLYRIFTYSPKVPKLMTAFYIALVVGTMIDCFLDNVVSDIAGIAPSADNLTDILRVVLGASIWIPYFNKSRRVANTFRAPDADRKIGEIF